VWMETFGAAPYRSTVITFLLHDYAATGATGPYLYQAILYESSNRILCQYKEMNAYASGNGRAATVGVRNLPGIGGVQYFYGNVEVNPVGPIENGLAIRFDPGPQVFLPVLIR